MQPPLFQTFNDSRDKIKMLWNRFSAQFINDGVIRATLLTNATGVIVDDRLDRLQFQTI